MRAIVVLAVVLVVVVDGAATCSRCKKRYARNPFKGDNPQVSRCPAGKCDHSYQCGSTLYVCWNLISPVDLGLCLDKDCNNDASLVVNDQIQSIEYCFDESDNDLMDIGIDCGQLCSLNPTALDTNAPPDQIIGNEICPNGERVQRYTKFCSPDGADGIGNFDACPTGGGKEDCEMPFCDFGADRPFRSTRFPHPTPYDDTTTTVRDETNISLPPTLLMDDTTLTIFNLPTTKPTKNKKAKTKTQTVAKKNKPKVALTTTQTIAKKKGKNKNQKLNPKRQLLRRNTST
jgi:hypothetical protein